jgi:DNA helicase HerA-like ATPase
MMKKFKGQQANQPQPNTLSLGYDLDMWNNYGIKEPIVLDISPSSNSHILLCGMSGSGKTYLEQILINKLIVAQPDGILYFADYKGDDAFNYLRRSPEYYQFRDTLEALNEVYSIINERLAVTY